MYSCTELIFHHAVATQVKIRNQVKSALLIAFVALSMVCGCSKNAMHLLWCQRHKNIIQGNKSWHIGNFREIKCTPKFAEVAISSVHKIPA